MPWPIVVLLFFAGTLIIAGVLLAIIGGIVDACRVMREARVLDRLWEDGPEPEYCECGAHVKGTPCYLSELYRAR